MPLLDCVPVPLVRPNPELGGLPNVVTSAPLCMMVNGPTVTVEVGFDSSMFMGMPGHSVAAPPQTLGGQHDGTGPVLPTDVPEADVSPSVMSIRALIDTGASNSCIDDDIATDLRLPLIDTIQIGGVGGAHMLNRYLARLVIPQLSFSRVGAFTGAKMVSGGQIHRALIGRDFLSGMLLVYDGLRGQVKLAV
jgi:predicted aspartyl protease